MAGSLIKIQETTLVGSVSSVTLTGIDSTYDIYQVVINNAHVTTDQTDIRIRFTESGTPNTTSNYDVCQRNINSNQDINNQTHENSDTMDLSLNIGNGTGEQFNSVIYIYNAPNSSEYTSVTMENSMMSNLAENRGKHGAGTFTVASAVDGIQFIESMDEGTFTLYGLKK